MTNNYEGIVDMGVVTQAGDPSDNRSVTWVEFGALPVLGEPDPGNPDQYSIPVSTTDLSEAGIDPRTEQFFWATINIAAQQKSEVMPRDFEALATLTPEQEALAEAAWRGETI